MSETPFKVKPILFSGAMVRSILDGRKTQTRRIIKRLQQKGAISEFGPTDTLGYDWHFRDREARWHDVSTSRLLDLSPYAPGDVLWVRETWAVGCRPCPRNGWVDGIEYRADDDAVEPDDCLPLYIPDAPDEFDFDSVRSGWRPSIHMPRWAARIWLRVTNVRAQRVQEISREDAIAEGVTVLPLQDLADSSSWWQVEPGTMQDRSPQEVFFRLWRSIHGNDADLSQWVWAITFEQIEKPEGA